jgi:hypothetical protein
MDLKLSDEQLNGVIAGAVLQAMTPEARQELLAKAVGSLLTPKKESWQKDAKSPLQEAFERAVFSVAHDVCREELKNDTVVREKVRGMVVAAVEKAMLNQEKIVENLAARLSDLLSRD